MPSTKIINVLRTDGFEDILDIFKEASAEEVILVLPKTGKLFHKEEHFQILSVKAQEGGKTVSLLCANPDVNVLAAKYGFNILSTEQEKNPAKPKKAKPAKTAEAAEERPLMPEDTEENREDNNDDIPAGDGEVEPAVSGKGLEPDPVPDDEYLFLEQNLIEPATQDAPDDYEVMTAAKMDRTRVKTQLQAKAKQKAGQEARQEEKMTNFSQKALDEIKSVWQSQTTFPDINLLVRDKAFRRPAKQNLKRSQLFRLPDFLRDWSRKTVFWLSIFTVILLGVIVYVSTGNARIIIKPREQKVDFRLKVASADKFSKVDLEANRIPGQLFDVEKTITEKFDTTGEKAVAQKAKGKIKIFNEYGTSPQTLIATTRLEFKSALSPQSGIIFRTLKTVTVPGMRVENGQVTPGSVEVEVIADKAGPLYNVEAGSFTIPAFKERGDSARYEKYYGQSSEAMRGGASGKTKVVTESDYTNAKSRLEAGLIGQIEEALKTQTTGLKILVTDKPKIKSYDSTAQIDDAANNFSMTISGDLEIIGFKLEDVHALISAYLEKTNELQALPEKLDISFENARFNSSDKTLGFEVAVRGVAYKKIDSKKIIDDLMGKNEFQIKEYIKNVKAIASAKVVLSPVWVKKIPKNPKRIKLEISY